MQTNRNQPVKPDTGKAMRRAGRPREFDREAALQVALDLFWRQGFEGTSTMQLTAAMGISQPSLYAAFGSKEALFREAIGLYQSRYGASLLEPMSDERLPVQKAIEMMLLAAARQFSDPRHAPGCMISTSGMQAAPGHAMLFEEIAAIRRMAQDAICQRLETAHAKGELSAGMPPEDLAAFFSAVIQGMAVQAKDGMQTPALECIAQLAVMTLQPRESEDSFGA
jgi:TetR/AcrR family transcriptional regulator, copper-responsive repressor